MSDREYYIAVKKSGSAASMPPAVGIAPVIVCYTWPDTTNKRARSAKRALVKTDWNGVEND